MRSERNSTFKRAWDVGAAGYIDQVAHRDNGEPKKKDSRSKAKLWLAAADEISRDLNIERALLPIWEHYRFFWHHSECRDRSARRGRLGSPWEFRR